MLVFWPLMPPSFDFGATSAGPSVGLPTPSGPLGAAPGEKSFGGAISGITRGSKRVSGTTMLGELFGTLAPGPAGPGGDGEPLVPSAGNLFENVVPGELAGGGPTVLDDWAGGE